MGGITTVPRRMTALNESPRKDFLPRRGTTPAPTRQVTPATQVGSALTRKYPPSPSRCTPWMMEAYQLHWTRRWAFRMEGASFSFLRLSVAFLLKPSPHSDFPVGRTPRSG